MKEMFNRYAIGVRADGVGVKQANLSSEAVRSIVAFRSTIERSLLRRRSRNQTNPKRERPKLRDSVEMLQCGSDGFSQRIGSRVGFSPGLLR